MAVSANDHPVKSQSNFTSRIPMCENYQFTYFCWESIDISYVIDTILFTIIADILIKSSCTKGIVTRLSFFDLAAFFRNDTIFGLVSFEQKSETLSILSFNLNSHRKSTKAFDSQLEENNPIHNRSKFHNLLFSKNEWNSWFSLKSGALPFTSFPSSLTQSDIRLPFLLVLGVKF